MSEQIFRYVRLELIETYEALGWHCTGSLSGCFHGQYSELMEWRGSGEPQEPESNE